MSKPCVIRPARASYVQLQTSIEVLRPFCPISSLQIDSWLLREKSVKPLIGDIALGGTLLGANVVMKPVAIGMLLLIIPSTLFSLDVAAQLYLTTTTSIDPTCDSACQALKQFSQDMARARNEASEEEGQEATGGQTLDDLMAQADEEREFDDQRAVQEQQENGIEDAENIPSARLLRFDIVLKNELLNQTFARILNNNTTSQTPEIEEFEERIDSDGTTAQRQIISYEFNPDISEDDIRIYTAAGQTVQNLSSVLAANINTTSIKMFENGKMVITCDGENSFDEADDTRIYAPHNYTAANGYRYVNSTIVDAAGNEVLKTGTTPDLSQYIGTESAC